MTTRFGSPKPRSEYGIQAGPVDGGKGFAEDVPRADLVGAASQYQATAGLIDEAIAAHFAESGVDPATADVLRSLMKDDPNSGIAHAYYQSKAGAGMARAHMGAVRKRIVVPYVLDDEEVSTLSRYAPEYTLEFRGLDAHDHPVAAASRMIDQALVESRIPSGMHYTDIGGSAEHHVKQAADRVHICQPQVDVKDPARAVQREARIKAIAVDGSRPLAVREHAKKYLARDENVVCGLRAQDCMRQSAVGICIHVYDIPMGDWPLIMENKGMKLVEGCMLFSPQVFDVVSGRFSAAGSRYEVDPKNNVFRMGFVNSPSWEYEHNWLEYCKYGVDQVLYGKKGAYSYKVVERRGDTIFFRIIPVSACVPRNFHQTYRLPGVEMVEVEGFEVGKRVGANGNFQKRKWVWPKPLWMDMMRHATEMVERGTLTLDRMYNYYRTIAPRQTINAQCVAGGYTVPVQELAPLVVHSSLAAASSVYLSQGVSRQIIGSELGMRLRNHEFTVVKALDALFKSIKAALGLVLLPAVMLGDAIAEVARQIVQQHMVEWAPRAVITNVNAKFLVTDVKGFDSNDYSVDELDLTDVMLEEIPFDHVRAAMNDPSLAGIILECFSEALPDNVLSDIRSVVAKSQTATDKVDSVLDGLTLAPSASVPDKGKSVVITPKDRRDAVLEAIAECEAEQLKIQASCAEAFRTLCPGKPSLNTIKRRLEEFRNPDFWWIEAGIVVRSICGYNVEDFHHAAVYIPAANPDTDSFIRPVFTEDYVGESQGQSVERVYFVIADRGYTGWALVNDSLQIYNGPELVSAMKLSLDKSFDFEVKLVQGPPGCGKTTSIVRSYEPGCVVLCPVRKSTEETRDRLVEERGKSEKRELKKVVRTLDSYLVNYGVSREVKSLSPVTLLADEAFMSHSGKWYAAAALLGVDFVRAFGDLFQIPHVPRAETSAMHVKMKPDEIEYQWLTYRCPADAVAAWGHIYDWRVRTVSSVSESLQHVPSHVGLNIPSGCVMMGMYQADKKELRQKFANCGVKVEIMTVHESQGKTFDHVWLHRFDRRRRVDNFSLYDKEPYVLVAMSRHRQTFKYVCPDLNDLASNWIKQAKNVRRVQAAADVESAGLSVEFK